jgi:hypothetical protein
MPGGDLVLGERREPTFEHAFFGPAEQQALQRTAFSCARWNGFSSACRPGSRETIGGPYLALCFNAKTERSAKYQIEPLPE